MSRGSGVRPSSGGSIAISFEFRGVRCREKIKIPPTETNLRYVRNKKAVIEHEIATGVFDYLKHFPNSKLAKRLAEARAARP